jgi:hypothetical protein
MENILEASSAVDISLVSYATRVVLIVSGFMSMLFVSDRVLKYAFKLDNFATRIGLASRSQLNH